MPPTCKKGKTFLPTVIVMPLKVLELSNESCTTCVYTIQITKTMNKPIKNDKNFLGSRYLGTSTYNNV